MTYELGRAEFIIDLNNEQAIADMSKTFNEATVKAQQFTAQLAEQFKVRERDIRAAADIEIAEARRAAAEALKAQKAAAAEAARVAKEEADDRKKSTQVWVAYNKQQYAEDVKAANDAAKAKAKADADAAKQRLQNIKDQIKDEVNQLKESEKAYNDKLKADQEATQKAYQQRERVYQQDVKKQVAAFQQGEQAAAAHFQRLQQQSGTFYAEQVRQVAAANAQIKRQQSESGAEGIAGLLGFGSSAQAAGTAATLLGFGAIASGAVIARASILELNKTTIEANTAQQALAATFRESANYYKTYADAVAKTTGSQQILTERAAAEFGQLNKQFGLTSDQVKQLIPLVVELTKIYGGDLVENARLLSSGLEEGGESADRFGISLRDNAIKTSAQLTEQQKKLYDTLSITEKVQLRYNVLMASRASIEEAAKKRAGELGGAFDEWNRAVEQTSISLGKDLLPYEAQLIRFFANVLNSANKSREGLKNFLEINEEIARRKGLPGFIGDLSPALSVIFPDTRKEVEAQRAADRTREKDIQDQIDARRAQLDDLANKEKQRVDAANAAAQRESEIVIDNLKRQADARKQALQEQIRIAELRKQQQIQILQDQEKLELRAIDEIENARKEASRRELERLQAQKLARERAVEDELRDTLLQINRQKDATHAVTEEQIRQLEIQRDARLRTLEQQHEQQKDALDAEHRDRQHAFDEEQRQLEHNIQQAQYKLEDAHKKDIRRLEDSAEAAHKAHDEELRAIDRLVQKEEDRHTKRLRQIEDEARKQKDDIDAQIKGIDDIRRARENANRTSDLQDKVAEAQKTLTLAQGVGSPQQIADARAKLTGALRIGDPTAIKKAQDELVAISGKGNDAILAAQKDLAKAQRDLRDENLNEVEDAQKAELQSKKDAVDKQIEAEKRAEEDRNTRRKRTLDADKTASKDRLDDALKKIDKEKQQRNDAYEQDQRKARETADKAKQALADRRKAEEEKYRDDVERIDKTYKHEQEAIRDTYDGPNGYIQTLRRAQKEADDHYQELERLAHENADKQKREIADIYDNPVNGLFAQHANAERAAEASYEKQKNIIRDKFELARQEVEKAYHNTEGTGIIDKLQEMVQETENKVKDAVQKWEDLFKKGLTDKDKGTFPTTFKEALDQYDEFLRKWKERPQPQIRPQVVYPGIQIGPDPGLPGSVSQGGGGGSGSSPSMPTVPGGSGAPMPPDSGQVDMSNDRYIFKLGFGGKYNGHYQAAPGWEEDGNTAAWPNGPTRHKGQDLILPGSHNGYGQPIGAFYPGTIVQTHQYTGNPNTDPGGTYSVIQDTAGRTHWYMHLKALAKNSGAVRRGDLIGYLGDTGTEDINYPHLHYEVRDGLNNGSLTLRQLLSGIGSLDPVPYIRKYDMGNLFTNPTLTYDTHTGERGILAERGPERLLGRIETAILAKNPIRLTKPPIYDHSGVGTRLSNISSQSTTEEGDKFTYYGVAPENIIQQMRDDQRRQRVLRG